MCAQDIADKRFSITTHSDSGVDFVVLKTNSPHARHTIKVAVDPLADKEGDNEYFNCELLAVMEAWERLKKLCGCDLCKADIG